jgi:hypothetical protein
MQAIRAASATVRTNIGVLPSSDAQRSRWLSSVSVWAKSITENLPYKSSWGVEGSLWETCGGMDGGEITLASGQESVVSKPSSCRVPRDVFSLARHPELLLVIPAWLRNTRTCVAGN